MSNTNILNLPAVTGLSGDEYVPVVKDGTTKRAKVSQLDLTGTTPGSAQDANTVFAGPTSGSPDFPTFRDLVPADIPNGLPTGGSTGQILVKASATNYDTTWVDDPVVAQPANTVLAGPTSGPNADPTFRALVNADLPIVEAAKGGTGQSSYAVGDLLYASGATALSKLAGVATGNALISGGVATAPAWGKIGLTTHVSGILPVANGGSGVSSATAYAVLCGGTSSTNPFQSVASVGTTGQALLSNGAAALPTFQTLSSAVGAALTRVDDTNVTLTLGGAPTTALLSATSITAGWTGQLSIARGGTGQSTATAAFDALAPTTTRGDLIARGASSNGRLAIGTSGYLLSSNGTDPAWVGFTQAGTGATTRTWQAKLREVQFSAADFGVVCDGVTVNTTALQAAIDAANAAVMASPSTGVARVYIPPGQCLTGQITLRDRVLIGGDSPQSCEIKAINGLNDDLFITPNFASLTGTNKWLEADGVLVFIGFFQCRIDGNKSNQTAGSGVVMYAKGLYFDNVIIFNCYEDGLYTETGEDPTVSTWPTLPEGFTGSVQLLSNNGHGWLMRGPHDLYANKVTSLLNGGDGLRIESVSGDYLATADFQFLHCYGNTGRGLTVVDSSAVKIGIARLEDNQQEGLYYDNADNCEIGVLSLFDNCITSGSYQGVIDADSLGNVIGEMTCRTVGRAAAGGFQLLGIANRVSGVIQGDVSGGAAFSTGVGLDMPTGALYCFADVTIANFSGVGGTALRTANGGAIQFNHIKARLLNSSTLWNNVTQGALNHYDIIGNCTALQLKFTGQQPTIGATREMWTVQLRDDSGAVFFWGTPLLVDSNGTHSLGFACGSNLTDHRVLTLTTGDANRTLDISAADVTISSAAAGVLDETSVRAMCAALGTPYVVGQSAVAVSHTGSTSETALATVTIPAGAMGANGRLRILTTWSTTNDASNKTYRVRLGGIGGTAFTAAVSASLASMKLLTEIANRNAANSQVGGPANYSGLGGSGAAVVTAAINTASAQDIVITGELADSADTITLESYCIEVLYGV